MSGEPGGKSIWTSLEIVKIVVGVLTPLTIFCLGQSIAKIEKVESERRADAAARNALIESNEAKDRDITKVFTERLRQTDVCKNQDGIALLVSLATPVRSGQLSAAYKNHCPETKVGFADQAVENTLRATASVLISGLSSPDTSSRRVARTELTEAYQSNPKVVGPLLAEAVEKNFENYRITLGVLVVLGSVNGGWSPQGSIATQFNRLGKSRNQADPTFKQWYEAALKNKKRAG